MIEGTSWRQLWTFPPWCRCFPCTCVPILGLGDWLVKHAHCLSLQHDEGVRADEASIGHLNSGPDSGSGPVLKPQAPKGSSACGI